MKGVCAVQVAVLLSLESVFSDSDLIEWLFLGVLGLGDMPEQF